MKAALIDGRAVFGSAVGEQEKSVALDMRDGRAEAAEAVVRRAVLQLVGQARLIDSLLRHAADREKLDFAAKRTGEQKRDAGKL